jgi:hypothetical protein
LIAVPHLEVAPPDVGTDGGDFVGRVALVAVGAIDRRAASAAAFAAGLRPDTLLAVHVAVDGPAAQRLGGTWARSPLGVVPLHVVDDAGGVASTIRLLTTELLADGAHDVTVVVGRLAMPGVARMVLHDRTSGAISRALAAVPGARVALVPVATRRR